VFSPLYLIDIGNLSTATKVRFVIRHIRNTLFFVYSILYVFRLDDIRVHSYTTANI